MTATVFATLAFALAAFAVLGRVAFMTLYRTELLGALISHDYSKEQRHRDEDLYLLDWSRQSNTQWRPRPRKVAARVEFAYHGETYRSDVATFVRGGRKPARLVPIWIDPKNPSNATAQGPGYWFCIAAVLSLGSGLAAVGKNKAVNTITCVASNTNCDHYRNELKPLGPDAWKHKQAPADSSTSF